MPLTLSTIPTLGFYYLVYHFVDKIIADAGGDPEGKLADEIVRREHLAQAAYMAPAHRAEFEADIAERYVPSGRAAEEAALVRGGVMDLRIAGRESRQLLANVAQRMGTTPEALSQKIDPSRHGDMMELSKAAFGRRPKVGAPNGG